MEKVKKILFYLIAIFFLIITIVPFILTIIISLSPLDDIANKTFSISHFSLENYIYILVNFPFSRWLVNSLIIAVGVTGLNLIINSLIGYSIARHKNRGILIYFIILCMMIPPQVLLAPMYIELVKFGMINTYVGMILPFSFNLFYIFLMKQYFENLPYELEESAYMDGISEMRTFWSIILPCAKIPLISQAILIFTANWNAYLWPSIIATTDKMYTLPVGLNSFYGQYDQFWNSIMAGVILLTLPTLVIFLIFQKYFTKGIATSGLK